MIRSAIAILIVSLGLQTFATAETELSQKAKFLELNSSRQDVIDILGPATHIIHTDEDHPESVGLARMTANMVRYKLIWDNGECSPVSTMFASDDERLLTIDRGILACYKTPEANPDAPKQRLACSASAFGQLCR